VLAAIYAFLGVDEDFTPPDMEPRNVGATKVRQPNGYKRMRALRRRLAWPRLPAPLQALVARLTALGSRDVRPLDLSAADERLIWDLLAEDIEALSALMGRDMAAFWNVPTR
jgi:hypothetical protein